MQYHPDRNPDDKGAEGEFKEIDEAYEVLRDTAAASGPTTSSATRAFGTSGFGGASAFRRLRASELFEDPPADILHARSLGFETTWAGARRAGGPAQPTQRGSADLRVQRGNRPRSRL